VDDHRIERVESSSESLKAVHVYIEVANHLEVRIADGEFAAGSRMPGARILAAEYGVALGTVRRAMTELRERRLVVTLGTKGTFVT
jgi:GntR family transcriptional regulator